MTSIAIKTNITIDELLHGVEQLSFPDLEQFTERVLALKAKKQASTQDRAAILLAQIKKELSISQKNRLAALQNKQRQTTLNVEEHEELGQLATFIENMQATRILALGELAELRQQSVDELSVELGFQPIAYV